MFPTGRRRTGARAVDSPADGISREKGVYMRIIMVLSMAPCDV